MVNSVFNSVFSLLASRNQHYEAVTAVADTTCAHTVIIIIIVVVVVVVVVIIITIITIITLFYFNKIIQNKIYIKIRHSYKKLANKK